MCDAGRGMGKRVVNPQPPEKPGGSWQKGRRSTGTGDGGEAAWSIGEEKQKWRVIAVGIAALE